MRHKLFEKHFKARIATHPKKAQQFARHLQYFIDGIRDYPLNDHPLTGSMAGKRSFSVANDLRVIYEETEDSYVFLDIGTHAQVYK